MSYNKQVERFGRVTGHTLRRSPQSIHFTELFVIMKCTNEIGSLNQDDIDHQFQDVMNDGHLQVSGDIAYSLNKQKRWELPGLLKESICSDRDVYEDLDFKVLLVEQHIAQNVFRPVCTGLYDSKASQPERLPCQKYAHAGDLQKADQEALRVQINKLRCSKNRGGKKVNWRSVMDAMQEKMRQEEQQQEREEEDIPQLRYEVINYSRPETKYLWRPDMKMKRSMGTKKCHKDTTACYLEDAEIMEDIIQDDILEEVRLQSELEAHPQDDAIDSGLIISENHPMPTFGEILCGLTRKPKQCKKRYRKKSGSSTAQTPKKSITSNQATSEPVRVHGKGSIVYDPDGIVYKPQPKPLRKTRRRTRRRRVKTPAIAATLADVPAHDDNSDVENLSLVYLWVDHESLKPSRLEAEFGMAYAEAQCKPRRFAVQVCDGSTGQDSNPTNKVYALFELLTDDFTNIECGESEAVQSWKIPKEGGHMRMTVYGRKDRLFISCESLSTAFPSTGIFSVQEVMTYLQSELQKPLSCCDKVSPFFSPSQGRTGYGSFRHVSLDIPTVRAVLGWDCSFHTADKAYQDIKDRQTNQPCIDCNNRDPKVTSDTCDICYDMYESVSLTADGESGAATSAGVIETTVLVSCGHCFCNQCWRRYLNTRVMQGTADITCPGYKCGTPIDPVTTMAFLSPAQFHAHYKDSRDAALARDSQRRRCPNPLCGRVAQMKGGDGDGYLSSECGNDNDNTRTFKAATVVRCECRRLWCTECMEEGHWPATCLQAKEYRKLLKKKIEGPSKPLITHVEVKRCPGCKTRWEKNGGCPSMICSTCNLNFCWLCLRPFTEHDFDNCRKFMKYLESVHLDFHTRFQDAMFEVAFECHKHRLWSALRKGWIAAAKLASRSVMVHISDQMMPAAGTNYAPAAMIAVKAALTPADNCQPLTWARTQEHLEVMNKKLQESYQIASFCHEGNFVLEHLALLLGSLSHCQRKAKWVKFMLDLRFILQDLEETLANLPSTKRSLVTMDKLCALVRAGKECLMKLARSMPRLHHD